MTCVQKRPFHKYPYFIDLKCSLLSQLFILPAQFESIYISRQTFVVTNLFLKLGRNCNLSSYEVILRQTYLQINQQDILLLFSSTYTAFRVITIMKFCFIICPFPSCPRIWNRSRIPSIIDTYTKPNLVPPKGI